MVSEADKQRVISRIRSEELSTLVMRLVEVESPSGNEKNIGDYLYSWLDQEGFSPRRVGMLPGRFNVAGVMKGKGDGYRLLFNAHMDTAPERSIRSGQPVRRAGWIEGDRLYGHAVMNDKGPMACFMLAAKAIKDSSVSLLGDLVLTMVCGEIGRNPIEEIVPPESVGREVGARWLVTHGPNAHVDFALVAEATGGGCAWVECGEAGFKVTIRTERSVYLPHFERPESLEKSLNAVVRATPYIRAFESWAQNVYEKRWRYESAGGTVVPKCGIAAVRGGDPAGGGGTPDECEIYLRFFTPPNIDPVWIERELLSLGESTGVPAEVEMYSFSRGHEGRNVEPLVHAIAKAHKEVFGTSPNPVRPDIASMWRDVNVFNEVGIPSVTYGPGASMGMYAERGTVFVTVDELVAYAKSYALIALDLCNQERRTGANLR